MELFGRILLLFILTPFFEVSEGAREGVRYSIKRILDIIHIDGEPSYSDEEISESIQSSGSVTCEVAEVYSRRSSVDGYEQIDSSSVSDYEQSDERKCHSD